jgi:TolB protein
MGRNFITNQVAKKMSVTACPHCNSDHPPEASFCPNTGLPLSRLPAEPSPLICPRCGKELQLSWPVCPFCGHATRETSGLQEREAGRSRLPKAWVWTGLLLTACICLAAGLIGLYAAGSVLASRGVAIPLFAAPESTEQDEPAGGPQPVEPAGLTTTATFTQPGSATPEDTAQPSPTPVADTVPQPTFTATLSPPTPAPTLPLPPSAFAGPAGKIVYTCQVFKDNLRDQICMVNADGSGQVRLTKEDQADHQSASLAPDGRSVVFSARIGRVYQIYEMAFSSPARLLAELPWDSESPEISPDGHRVVFAVNDQSTRSIWIVNRDGTSANEISFGRGGNAWDPTWSPDGQRIAFAADFAGGVQLFTANLDGLGLEQATDTSGLRGRSAWSPAGDWLATYLGSEWNWEITLFNLITGEREILTRGGNNLAPSFSPDGKYLTFMSYRDHPGRDQNGCEIYTMQVDGSQVSRLTDNDTCDWQPRWGP